MKCTPHYIRCIKPNETKKPKDWEESRYGEDRDRRGRPASVAPTPFPSAQIGPFYAQGRNNLNCLQMYFMSCVLTFLERSLSLYIYFPHTLFFPKLLAVPFSSELAISNVDLG